MGGDDDVRESVEGLASLITRQNAGLREAQARMRRLRGKGTAADERVTVEVDRFGALVDLRIDPRAMRLGSQVLAEAILDAARRGVRDVRAQADDMMRPLVTELAATNVTIGASAGTDFAGRDVEDVLAAFREVRQDLSL
jgi:DNA-binding protein YbaB